jgi:DeoR/GlpR family transcriptional regulator of sugar metabolism
MAKRNSRSEADKQDTLANLDRLLLEEGRMPLEAACARVSISESQLREAANKGKYAIGIERDERGRDNTFLVSASRELRLHVIANVLERNHPRKYTHVELKAILGVPEKSTILDKVIPHDHPSIRRERGIYWWVADKSDPTQLASVAAAARGLLYQSDGIQQYVASCSDRVKLKLRRLWERTNLNVAIDGGRTNTLVAKELARQRLPQGSVRMVTYLTNYKPIEQAIYDKRESNLHDPILIGGRMRDHSKTYVGRFAEACWNSYGITPDVAIVATSTVSERGDFATSDFEESRFKSLLLGASSATLRCITGDSGKILAMRGSGWTFASLDNVDIIVTDRSIWSKGSKFIEDAKTFGVLVVTELPGPPIGEHL